jgi:hypothetical protein
MADWSEAPSVVSLGKMAGYGGPVRRSPLRIDQLPARLGTFNPVAFNAEFRQVVMS